MKKYLIGSIIVLIAVMAAWFVSNHSQHSSQGAGESMVARTGESGEAVSGEEIPVVQVKARHLDRDVHLPAELEAFRDVAIHAKITGYIQKITVDRGSRVQKGQLLIKLTAPEIEAQCSKANAALETSKAQLAEAISKLRSHEAHLSEARAKLAKDEAIHSRLAAAARVPGTISGNELDKSAKDVDFDRAHVQSMIEEIEAARSLVKAHKKQVSAAEAEYKSMLSTREYLTILAPFDGVITERNVHEGSLVGRDGRKPSDEPALRIQQVSVLRLVVYVPEEDVSGIKPQSQIEFKVKAFPGRNFAGTVSRVGHALDRKTRTMPVELDVNNDTGMLEPGMFANVFWPETRPYDTLFVPSSAVVSSLAGDFVIRVQSGKTEKVKVTRGKTDGNSQEVFGALKPGENVMLHGSEEIESGQSVHTRVATAEELEEQKG
ncbi:MAG: efflux RND transporter periplasmic adaptor subunit [Cyanobacteriota/Melainabacteria group bacterium]|nr:efflux RND transporter periplasmic adaptor subunit [Cyanobacteria bacterium HKST-UBA01]MCB9472168.1 efflux RND transporter periplasmic adaptor subunit [Candidatus Obscuribacterales bacterium]